MTISKRELAEHRAKCATKRKYGSFAAARRGGAAASLFSTQCRKFYVYKCPFCGAWHVTTHVSRKEYDHYKYIAVAMKEKTHA